MAAPDDREAALFDLLAGWVEYVESKVRRGRSVDGALDAEGSPGTSPAVPARWRWHYNAAYLRRIQALREMAGVVLWDDDAEEGMRADEWLRRYLVPFFAPTEE